LAPMASRAEAKAKAKAERLEFERKLAEEARRKQRLLRLGGVVAIAVIAIVVAIAVSSGNGGTPPSANKITSPADKAVDTRVDNLLSGIGESGNNTLGNPTAPIQVTMFGDLECSACDDFTLATTTKTSDGTPGSGVEDDLINQYVKTGKASLVYRSLETATANGATPDEFVPQQAAALDAGLQGKAWYYIELFYNEQQPEGTPYVNQTFLENIAKQVPGLNYSKWLSNLNNSTLNAQVTADNTSASSQGLNSTPAIVVKGPKGQAQAFQGVPTWAQVQSMIAKVS
jgi:protein-disulfide isomerase